MDFVIHFVDHEFVNYVCLTGHLVLNFSALINKDAVSFIVILLTSH